VRVGRGVAPILVPAGTPLGGYADRSGPSTGTVDPLEVHVVTISDGTRRLALVVLDVVCVNTDLAAAVRAALSDVDDVWTCATHTHSGPETGCVPGGAATPAPWPAVIAPAAAEAARAAVAAEVPGSLTAAEASVTGVASVRSRPDGARPVPVDVVFFHRSDGRLGGALAVLPIHPTVLPASSTVVSADLTGAVRRALSARLGTWVVVLTGAAGDISTRGVRRAADPAECARLGNLVADQVVPAVVSGSRPGTVRTASADLLLTPGTPPVDRSTVDPSTRQGETLRQAWRVRRPVTDPLPATVRAARIGDLNMIGLPGEPFLDLRSAAVAAGGPLLLLGYVGGYVGYLPTRAAFAAEPTYETVISPVAAGESERLVDMGVSLLSCL
jgi:hypothetical protein